MAFDEGQSTTSCPAEGEEMNANELFRKDEKPVGQWFMLALLAFTIIDYFLLERFPLDVNQFERRGIP